MSVLGNNVLETVEIAKSGVADAPVLGTSKEAKLGRGSIDVGRMDAMSSSSELSDDKPTEDELHTLRRVSGKIPWTAYTIAFCELCERFSYYGTTVVFVNFIQQPLPEGSTTGAGFEGQSGALGMGQRASTGLTLFNQFWAYVMPLVGAYIADAHLGRYKTIHIAIVVSFVAHIILTASAAPKVIVHPNSAIAAFIVGLISLGIGTGFFKANISPLLAEQNLDTKMRIEVQKGERVIVDPAITNTRIFLYFYLCINIGSLVGQIGMVYAEKYVGFWLSYLLPTVMFITAPIVLACFRKNYILSPPTGSVLSKFMHMFGYVMKGKWTFNFSKMKKNFTWDIAKPSNVPIEARPVWMTYDDAWVDEVRRGLKACKVFLFLPLFHLAYNQMTGNLTSQAATMQLHGVPNDIIQNLNPISIVIMIPIMDHVIYPGLRKLHINFTPIKRMCLGFFFGSAAMIAACVTQVYIYRMSPCGTHAGDPDCEGPAPINVWVQTLPYVLIGISEIFTNISSYEYAFSKAPDNMKSLVMSVNLFMSAVSSAIGQGFTALSTDPLLVWNYGLVAVLAFAGGVAFWVCFRQLDKDEDKWNSIAKSAYRGKSVSGPGHNESVISHEVSEKV